MAFKNCVENTCFLTSLSISCFLGGCGESVQPPAEQGKQAASFLSDEQVFAISLKKAEAGDAKEQVFVGLAYETGEGVPKDTAKAIEWLEKGAAQGDALGQGSLGRMYLYGLGIPKDVAKALDWSKKAAEQGLAPGLYQLGEIYKHGEGVPKDDVKAFECYQKAAQQGYVLAQITLGALYMLGDGVPRNAAKEFEWFQKAAVQGDGSAQFHIAQMYDKGEGVPKDSAKAFDWYQKAAIQDYSSAAQTQLGVKYFNGQGVSRDVVLAYAWINLATVERGWEVVGTEKLAPPKEKFVPPKDAVEVFDPDKYLKESDISEAVRIRGLIEPQLSKSELSEAQRLSSEWKKGQVIVREAQSGSSNSASTPGALSKKGTGTIFVVSKNGQAVTNQHVVGNCTELRIQGREGLAKLVVDDKVNDLALVQLPGAEADAAPIASEPGKLRQGEDIVAFGFPLNSVLSAGGNLTPGVVSALTGLGNNTNQFQITAPIQPGSSGSPVLNKEGEVVGVVSMKLDDAKMAKATGQVGQNINFAVNGQTLKTFLDTQKVAYSTGSFFSWEKNTADLADEARKWTWVVECWK